MLSQTSDETRECSGTEVDPNIWVEILSVVCMMTIRTLQTGRVQMAGDVESTTEDLYARNMREMSDAAVVVGEPRNGGPRLSDVVSAVNGMGDRATTQGTIVRFVRSLQNT